MKYIFLLTIVASSVIACNSTDASKKDKASAATLPTTMEDTTQFTTMEWIDSVKDYGKINEGQQLAVAFRFKNTGDKPLVIRRVQPSCGCTVANPPDKPIAPGEEGTINATFNSNGRVGINRKDIYVNANTKGSQDHKVHFDVEVIKKS